MKNEDYDKYLKKIFAVSAKTSKTVFADEPSEVEVEPGVFHFIGKSGRVYAIYGDKFRKALKKHK